MKIVALYASLLTLLYLVLSWKVVKLRRGEKVGIGDGKIDKLSRAIRVHANFIEYVPLALILIAATAFFGLNDIYLHALGTILLIARILHAYGLSESVGTSFGRFWGTLLTWLLLALMSLVNIGFFLELF